MRTAIVLLLALSFCMLAVTLAMPSADARVCLTRVSVCLPDGTPCDPTAVANCLPSGGGGCNPDGECYPCDPIPGRIPSC